MSLSGCALEGKKEKKTGKKQDLQGKAAREQHVPTTPYSVIQVRHSVYSILADYQGMYKYLRTVQYTVRSRLYFLVHLYGNIPLA
jgi:hypothetical protein